VAKKIRVGIVGCGTISPAYFGGCAQFDILEIAACADLDPARAAQRAGEFGVARALPVEELLNDPGIDLVVNLTIPMAHTEVNVAALAAGKHVYCEKPLAIHPRDGERTLAFAREHGLRVGCAPDTVLGGGIQTCRKLMDEGAIGEPVAAAAFMACHGHESWHPEPAFYYQAGGGPMLDMGPYYLTALVNLLGPARRVTGATRVSFPERITAAGDRIRVETATHLTGTVEFRNEAIATILMSFDVWAHQLPIIEIYGSEGTLAVPDPNGFGGPVRLKRAGEADWQEVPLTHRADAGRGIGVADMACGLASGRPHRVNGEVANHVLEIMTAFEAASTAGRHVELASSCTRPPPLPAGLEPGKLDP